MWHQLSGYGPCHFASSLLDSEGRSTSTGSLTSKDLSLAVLSYYLSLMLSPSDGRCRAWSWGGCVSWRCRRWHSQVLTFSVPRFLWGCLGVHAPVAHIVTQKVRTLCSPVVLPYRRTWDKVSPIVCQTSAPLFVAWNSLFHWTSLLSRLSAGGTEMFE